MTAETLGDEGGSAGAEVFDQSRLAYEGIVEP